MYKEVEGFRPAPASTNKLMCPPHELQVTAADLAVLNASGVPMEQLIVMALFYDFSVCGGAILVDGGQSLTPARLVLEDCEIRNTRAEVAGGAIAQFGTSHIEVGLGSYHHPRHPTHREPSSLESNGIP